MSTPRPSVPKLSTPKLSPSNVGALKLRALANKKAVISGLQPATRTIKELDPTNKNSKAREFLRGADPTNKNSVTRGVMRVFDPTRSGSPPPTMPPPAREVDVTTGEATWSDIVGTEGSQSGPPTTPPIVIVVPETTDDSGSGEGMFNNWFSGSQSGGEPTGGSGSDDGADSEEEGDSMPTEPEPEPQGDEETASGQVVIENPAESGEAVSYKLNDYSYTMNPGERQTLDAATPWIIEFERGDGQAATRYSLSKGTYTFSKTDEEWDLRLAPEAEPTP